MRFKPAFKYQLNEVKMPIIIYYGVVLFLMAAITVGLSIMYPFISNPSFRFGFEGASAIFLLIVGLNSHKSAFHMLSANGVSRKTLFTSFAVMAVAVSAGMVVIDSLISLFATHIVQMYAAGLVFSDITIYGGGFAKSLLWMFCSYLAALVIGYLITVLYYRMNKAIKLLVSIGVPVFFLIILPIVDEQLFGGAVTRALGWVVSLLSGTLTGSPLIGLASTVAIGALAFLAMRRAPLKA